MEKIYIKLKELTLQREELLNKQNEINKQLGELLNSKNEVDVMLSGIVSKIYSLEQVLEELGLSEQVNVKLKK